MSKMHSVLTNIPEEFVVESTMNGVVQYYPKYGGLLYLAGTMGQPILKTKIIPSSVPGEICAECEAYLIPNSKTLEELGLADEPRDSPFIKMMTMPIIAHGTVNKGNTKEKMQVHATVLAETRAKARALRDLTHCGYTSFEEMSESSLTGDPLSSNFTVSCAADMLNEVPAQNTFDLTTYDRKAYIEQLQTVAQTQPFKAILDRVCREFKTSGFVGLPDEGIQRAYKLCADKIRGQ